VAKSKKRNSKTSKRATLPENPPKTLVYEALATWNRDFELVLEDLRRLEALQLFPRRWRRQFLKEWRAALGEIRVWVSFEVTEVLHQAEEEEWTSLGRRTLIRRRGETGDQGLRLLWSRCARRRRPSRTRPLSPFSSPAPR
jgi:hypothetical protein